MKRVALGEPLKVTSPAARKARRWRRAPRSRREASRRGPWRIVTAIAFSDDSRAEEFERSLKTGSGAEFARRQLW